MRESEEKDLTLLIDETREIFFRFEKAAFFKKTLFIGCIILQLLAFFFLLFSSPLSFATAISLSLLIFTTFSYYSLKVYWLSKRGTQLMKIRDEFLDTLKGSFEFEEENLEDSIYLVFAIRKLLIGLEGGEYHLLQTPKFFQRIERLLTRHIWYDFFKLREILLEEVVDESIEMVKTAPLNLEVHASLANAYVHLANLYKEEKRGNVFFQEKLKEKFTKISKAALEEFWILKEFAPDDPWIFFQLAYIYRDLGHTEEEKKAYEEIVHLRPNDLESLFHLGKLYFSLGMQMKGLEIYQRLRELDEEKSDSLIKAYACPFRSPPIKMDP